MARDLDPAVIEKIIAKAQGILNDAKSRGYVCIVRDKRTTVFVNHFPKVGSHDAGATLESKMALKMVIEAMADKLSFFDLLPFTDG